ncbi:speedy protein 1-B-like isoform X2 [Hyla sarda]|uniref:speedy protein 1-B-like isoform X2 n=1 Tax=Hyla sarda TaxID=327740 RepID=UPI0024C39A94|nr:speedy protein 1-B-like isoform X2 [Hyla sarda]
MKRSVQHLPPRRSRRRRTTSRRRRRRTTSRRRRRRTASPRRRGSRRTTTGGRPLMTPSYSRRNAPLFTDSWYLLAMVFIYFRRANLRTEEYNTYFFPALFLANQFEEDEMFRREIYPWALGPMWTAMKTWMLHLRNLLLLRMRFNAWVTRDTCDRIMAQDPEHWAWKRERQEHHGWAIRWYRRDPGENIPRGPWWIPPACSVCNTDLQPCAGEENTKRRRTKEEDQNG